MPGRFQPILRRRTCAGPCRAIYRCNRDTVAGGRLVPVAEMVAPDLKQKQRQQKTAVGAVVAEAATDWILQNRKVFEVSQTKAG